jgi:hypothetical protein
MPFCDAGMNAFRNMSGRGRKAAAVLPLSGKLPAETKYKNWKTIAFSVEGISGKTAANAL